MKVKPSCEPCVENEKGPKEFLARECVRLEKDVREGATTLFGRVKFKNKSHAANVFLRAGINQFLAARGLPTLPINAFEQMVATDPDAIIRKYGGKRTEGK